MQIEVKLSLRRTIEEDWFLRMESHLQSNNMSKQFLDTKNLLDFCKQVF